MIPVSLVVEGQQGLSWPRWQRLVAAVDELGFAGLYRSDHFTDPAPPDRDSLELVVSLTYAALHTHRVRFGPLVAPVSFRDPVMLARQAAALSDLSEGRMVLGLGAGWQEREHRMFGYELGDMDTRFSRLEEALEVTRLLLRSVGPASFEGRHYRLREAELLPRPLHPGNPPILVGGQGPRRTLPLVARYADIWNSTRTSPEGFRESNQRLDQLLRDAGREPGEVRRTLFTGVFFATDDSDLDAVLRRLAGDSGASPSETLAAQRGRHMVVGTADMVLEQLAELEAAGVQEIMLRWTELDDLERLRAFSAAVTSAP